MSDKDKKNEDSKTNNDKEKSRIGRKIEERMNKKFSVKKRKAK
ncbi:MAG: hypothetical protein SCALA701_32300 [Candidatus Scalindua sp.]|nr:MAG: hypothetical protein SCALA701_32300 [Candidatus Scalindua sp.]